MEFTIKLAGQAVGIRCLYASTREFCRDYISREIPDFTVEVTPKDIALEREKSAAEDALEGIPTRQFSDPYLETLAVYRKIAREMVFRDVLLFHGSVIAVGEEAYLFAARSGVGKTTHTRLWLKEIPGSFVVNGDKPLLKITENGVVACGTPWQGKENYGCNTMVPLRGLALLHRGETNEITRISPVEAFTKIFLQSYRSEEPEEMEKILSLVTRLCENVRLYRLTCNMDPEAAKVSYEGMRP